MEAAPGSVYPRADATSSDVTDPHSRTNCSSRIFGSPTFAVRHSIGRVTVPVFVPVAAENQPTKANSTQGRGELTRRIRSNSAANTPHRHALEIHRAARPLQVRILRPPPFTHRRRGLRSHRRTGLIGGTPALLVGSATSGLAVRTAS